MLIDTHCHLASRQLRGETGALISRAAAAGVSRLIAIGTDLEDSRVCLEIAERHPEVYATVGIHPTSVTELPSGVDWRTELAELASHPKVVALGEMGLDFYHPPPAGWSLPDYARAQEEVLWQQLELAAELGRNVVIHNRSSWEQTVAAVRPFSGRLHAVFHCFTGSWADAEPLVDAGHRISFTGVVTFRNGAEILATAARAPEGTFMVETDAPYLAPVPHRGHRCEPAYVRHTAAAIAEARGLALVEVGRMTSETARSFFRLP